MGSARDAAFLCVERAHEPNRFSVRDIEVGSLIADDANQQAVKAQSARRR
jgi:hypothetical protein